MEDAHALPTKVRPTPRQRDFTARFAVPKLGGEA
jgi:hypothetical protein